ncbi:MAG: mannose-6-phosphate isomerase, partial [Terracidiphilus sp.]
MSRGSNYDKQPTIQISDDASLCLQGWAAIDEELRSRVANGKRVVVAAECYPGVDTGEVGAGLA